MGMIYRCSIEIMKRKKKWHEMMELTQSSSDNCWLSLLISYLFRIVWWNRSNELSFLNGTACASIKAIQTTRNVNLDKWIKQMVSGKTFAIFFFSTFTIFFFFWVKSYSLFVWVFICMLNNFLCYCVVKSAHFL